MSAITYRKRSPGPSVSCSLQYTSVKNGYDLPFVGNDSNVTLYIGILNVVLMLTSCIVGIVTVVLSFKGSRHKHFLKWRNVDRFIVYKAVNDIIYYLIQICYLVHITVQQSNYPDPVWVCAFWNSRPFCIQGSNIFNIVIRDMVNNNIKKLLLNNSFHSCVKTNTNNNSDKETSYEWPTTLYRL
jgi:hypothetical protein